jgi:hypothetical protein
VTGSAIAPVRGFVPWEAFALTIDDPNEDAVAEAEEALAEAQEAAEDAAASAEAPPLDPAVLRLYEELQDLDARGTSNNLETGRKLLELTDAGQTSRDIAKQSQHLGIDGCVSHSRVIRLTAYASLINMALEEWHDLSVPSEGAVRRLCVIKDPLDAEWSIDQRMEYLGRALEIAAEEHSRLLSRHVRTALEKDYPPPPKPEAQPMGPKVRRLRRELERLRKAEGFAALLRAWTLWAPQYGAEADEGAEDEQGEDGTDEAAVS